MPPHRWLLPKLMPNNEESVVLRAMRVEGPLGLTVGSSITLAPVRRPMTSSGPPVQALEARRLNGMPPPARTDAATCASRTPTPCAGMGTKRRVKNERRSLLILILSPALGGALFLRRSTRHRGGGFQKPGARGFPGCGDRRSGTLSPRYVSNDGPLSFCGLCLQRRWLEWSQTKLCIEGNDGQPSGGSSLAVARRARAKFIPNQAAHLVVLHRFDRRL